MTEVDGRLGWRILDGLAQGVAVWDAAGTCVFSNPSASALLEVDEALLKVGAPAAALLAELERRGDLTDVDVARIGRARAGEGPLDYERRLASGRVLSCALRPLRHGGSIAYLEDATAERTASAQRDAARAESERLSDRLEAVISRMDAGVLVWDAELRCVLRNERLLQLLGMTAEEVPIGISHDEFRALRRARSEIDPETEARGREAVRARRGFDIDAVQLDGRVLAVRSRPFDGGGQVTTITDITELRRLEEAHRATLRSLDEVLASMEQGLIVWDADGRCEMRNPQAGRLLELAEGVLEPGTRRDPFLAALAERGDISRERLDYVRARFASSEPFSFDRKLPSGRRVATHARPAADGSYIVTLTDVTEERRAAEELAALGEAAARAEADMRAALDRERLRREETRLSGQVDEWLQTCRSEEELCQVLRRAMTLAFPGARGEARLFRSSGAFERVVDWGDGGGSARVMEADDCWALRRGRRYLFEPGAIGLPCRHVPEQERGRTAICLPIVARGRTLGVVHLRAAADACADTDWEDAMALAARIAEHFGMAVSNMRGREAGPASRACAGRM